MSTHKTYIVALAIALVATLFVSIAQTAPSLKKRNFSGDGTFYSTGLGACGQVSSDSSLIAALNKPQWGSPANPNQNPICGKQALVHGPKGSVTVTIVDLCPECLFGSLDLSPGAFNQIGDATAGRIPITWEWLDGGAPPPPPPPPPAAKTTPPPVVTPIAKVSQSSTTTSATSTSTTSTSKTVKTPTPTPHRVPSVSFAFINGNYPFSDPSVVLKNGQNPFLNTQSFLDGSSSNSDSTSS